MPSVKKEELEERKYWHHGYYGITELELLEYKNFLKFSTELVLGKEPPRLDLLVIKKKKGIVIENDFGRMFRTYNICEYKGPGDSLSIDDYIKAVGYACLYKHQGKTVNERPMDELTVSIFRYAYPRELFNELSRIGAKITRHCEGVYYVDRIICFPTQIVITGQLDPQKHAAFRSMTEGADEKDVRNMLRFFSTLSEPTDIQNAMAALLVCSAANKDLFEEIRREPDMQNVLLDLMKEEVDKKVMDGEKRGEKRGVVRQAMETAKNLYEMGMDITSIARAVSQSTDNVAQWLGLEHTGEMLLRTGDAYDRHSD